MDYKRILTVQDISCFGQCSLTVALPILSACGVETVIIPSAVLSTHTGGFTDFTFRDLSDDIPKIKDHWVKEGIDFDAIYTGYLGSEKQINMIKDLFNSLSRPNCIKIVDPAMADNGKLYYGFDQAYADSMATLCSEADLVLPNITEACFMTGFEYKEVYDEEYVLSLLKALEDKGMENIILTGVSYSPETTGVLVKTKGNIQYYCHKRIPVGSHGTGDVFASAFSGALLSGKTEFDAAKVAAEYTLRCIENTQGDENHRYGVKFETAIPYLIELLGK
ncbi:MAG: pyridoxamine kinase [Ruminococcaceae bacterium]|nr:pyridoxamine kinase [Oscillospiraceae bacterium]